MIDIGKDLQDAFDDGYEKAMQDRWISVSEILPEEKGWYLVTTEDGKVDLGHWFFNEGWKQGHNSKVIAWQSLPEPYKE